MAVRIDAILSGSPAEFLESPPLLGGGRSRNNTAYAFASFPFSITLLMNRPHLIHSIRIIYSSHLISLFCVLDRSL